MTIEIISLSISTKPWDRAQIELAIPGSAGILSTDCAQGPVFDPWLPIERPSKTDQTV